MKHSKNFLARKHIYSILLPCICILLVGLACSVGAPKETRAPDSFPNTDLVFTTSGGIGFVNADGSNEVDIDFSTQVPGVIPGSEPAVIARPVITGDNHAIIAKVSTYISYWYMTNGNLLVLWRPGEYPQFCLKWGIQDMPLLTKDQNHILIPTEQGTALYEIDNCGTDKEPVATYQTISGVFSPDLQYVAEAGDINGDFDDRIITILNLKSGEERVLHPADFPAWSRDSQWLAYTGIDGIYVVNILKNTDPVRVVLYRNPAGDVDPTYSNVNQLPPPEVSWSPDGKWLVYHRLTVENYSNDLPSYYSIFKVNIETGEEIKIIDGGMYPYWRWPVEEP